MNWSQVKHMMAGYYSFIRLRKQFYYSFRLIPLFLSAALLSSNAVILVHAESNCFDDLDEMPELNTALLLGCSKFLKNGQPNPFFITRVKATKELYGADKVHWIIISGDHGRTGYNEPLMMKQSLLEYGVPDSIIYLDYAGFRTLDSVVRAQFIFGQDSLIIVTQKFHNFRATFLADQFGIHALGFNADMPSGWHRIKVEFREIFARFKAYLDIHVLDTKPKYYGEPVHMGDHI